MKRRVSNQTSNEVVDTVDLWNATQLETLSQMLGKVPGITDEVLQTINGRCVIIPNPGYGRFQYPLATSYIYHEVETLLSKNKHQIGQFFRGIEPAYRSNNVARITEEKVDEFSPYWRNNFIGRGDGSALYSVVSTLVPRLFVEVGVGNSTKFVRRAIQDNCLDTIIESIDPSPRANISGITDRHISSSVLDLDLTFVDRLESGDILFWDGSHVLLSGTDVSHLFLNILPRVKPGVIVHVHDIFLPWEYPLSFRRRQFNEQHVLAAVLLFSREWEILLPVHYAYMNRIVPYDGGSFWIRRVSR